MPKLHLKFVFRLFKYLHQKKIYIYLVIMICPMISSHQMFSKH